MDTLRHAGLFLREADSPNRAVVAPPCCELNLSSVIALTPSHMHESEIVVFCWFVFIYMCCVYV